MIAEITVFAALLAAAFQDLRKKEISAVLIWMTAAASVIYIGTGLFKGRMRIWEIALSLLPGAALLAIALLSREGIGYGDGLLLLAAGPAIGGGAVLAGLAIAFFLSGIISALFLAIKKVGRRYTIPFVPFLAIGIGVSLIAKI